jgi:shikimate kinase
LFHFSTELVSKTGAAASQSDQAVDSSKGKKKRRFQHPEERGEASVKSPHIPTIVSLKSSSSAAAANATVQATDSTPVRANDEDKVKKKANPYVLKPSRQGFGVQSTSYVPK